MLSQYAVFSISLLQYAVFVGMATKQSSNFFLIFPDEEIRHLLQGKDYKKTPKNNTQSRSVSVLGILVGKGDCGANRKRRNCSDLKNKFMPISINSAYQKTPIQQLFKYYFKHEQEYFIRL